MSRRGVIHDHGAGYGPGRGPFGWGGRSAVGFFLFHTEVLGGRVKVVWGGQVQVATLLIWGGGYSGGRFQGAFIKLEGGLGEGRGGVGGGEWDGLDRWRVCAAPETAVNSTAHSTGGAGATQPLPSPTKEGRGGAAAPNTKQKRGLGSRPATKQTKTREAPPPPAHSSSFMSPCLSNRVPLPAAPAPKPNKPAGSCRPIKRKLPPPTSSSFMSPCLSSCVPSPASASTSASQHRSRGDASSRTTFVWGGGRRVFCFGGLQENQPGMSKTTFGRGGGVSFWVAGVGGRWVVCFSGWGEVFGARPARCRKAKPTKPDQMPDPTPPATQQTNNGATTPQTPHQRVPPLVPDPLPRRRRGEERRQPRAGVGAGRGGEDGGVGEGAAALKGLGFGVWGLGGVEGEGFGKVQEVYNCVCLGGWGGVASWGVWAI